MDTASDSGSLSSPGENRPPARSRTFSRAQDKSLDAENERLRREIELLRGENNGLRDRVKDLEGELHQAYHSLRVDPLTGALNREGLKWLIGELGENVQQRGLSGRGAIVAIDLDRFKAINDTHGHPAGDVVLKAVVERLKEEMILATFAAVDVEVIRPGGDEFLLVALDRRSGSRNGAQDFEDYFKNFVDNAMKEVTAHTVTVPSHTGEMVEVEFGISLGYGFFSQLGNTELTHEQVEADLDQAFTMADEEAMGHKTGRSDFEKAYHEHPEVRAYFDSSSGVGKFREAGQREAALYFIENDAEFRSIKGFLNDRAMAWVFPVLKPQRAQTPTAPGR
jgi:diguanylate cyclase (GGDEF)-like protein